jgi:hypothetical protein
MMTRDDLRPLLAGQFRRHVDQPSPNPQEPSLETPLEIEVAALRQRNHRIVCPQHISKQPFDAVGCRFALDFPEQGGANAKTPPVVCNRHRKLSAPLCAGDGHPAVEVSSQLNLSRPFAVKVRSNSAGASSLVKPSTRLKRDSRDKRRK